MISVNVIITQLDLLNEKAKRSSKHKISEQDCRKVYDQICTVFPQASPDERVDLHIAFEDREPLIDALLAYMTRLAQDVTRLTHKEKRPEAINLLRQALIADALIDGRTDLETLQKVQNELLSAAQELKFDVNACLQMLETPAAAYLDRAYAYNKQQNRIQAIRALGAALQHDHTMRTNPRIGDLATVLTGEAAYSAVMMLEDSFTRNSLIRDMERRRKFQQAETQEAKAIKPDGQENFLQRMFGKRS